MVARCKAWDAWSSPSFFKPARGLFVPLAAVIAVAAATASPAHALQRFPATCSRSDFRSGSVMVPAELCRGVATEGRAVVVLHGCGGFSAFDHRLAVELPSRGIATLDVDYFAPTPPPGQRGFCDAHGRARNSFATWVRVAVAAARHLRSVAAVASTRVGVVGWSLGGGVALTSAIAARAERVFDAVAAFSTPGFPLVVADARLLPPTILLSGGSTDAEPLAATLPLYRALRAAGVPTSLYVYPHGSHQWPGEQGTLGIEHAAAFLRRELR